MPLVSILVASYGHARFLPTTIESVLAQTFTDWELLIQDDLSPDGSLEVARGYAARDPRILVEQNQANLGTYGTQQAALDRARGKWVAVLNSDDFWAPHKLERQLQSIGEAHLGFVLGWMASDDGAPIAGEDVHADWPTTPNCDLLPWLFVENRVLASAVLFRREALRFDPSLRYSGDWVALIRAARRGPAACLPERFTFWRQHEANSYVRREPQLLEEIRVRRQLMADTPVLLQLRPGEERKLAMNALNLSALCLLYGDVRAARSAAAGATRLDPKWSLAKKRRLLAWLPPAVSVRRLWPDQPLPSPRLLPKMESVDLGE